MICSIQEGEFGVVPATAVYRDCTKDAATGQLQTRFRPFCVLAVSDGDGGEVDVTINSERLALEIVVAAGQIARRLAELGQH